MCMFVYVHACVCLCVYACMCVCVCVSGSEKLQPDRIYVLGSKRELSDGQKLPVRLAAEYLDPVSNWSSNSN